MMKLRIFTGLIIAFHGLLRIVFINKYINFVHQNFSDLIPVEPLLTMGAALLPFLEFFVGLLLIFRVGNRRTVCVAVLISLFMSVFIIAGNLYPRLIYHGVVCTLLLSICLIQSKPTNRKFIV